MAAWLSAVVRESSNEEIAARRLARKASQSSTQFYRLFHAMIEETPGRMLARFEAADAKSTGILRVHLRRHVRPRHHI